MNDLKVYIDRGDHTAVKKYIIRSFCKNLKRRPKKSFHFYKTLVYLYKFYPDTVRNLINNVRSWGYPKDLMFILIASKNKELNELVYDFIATTLKDDTQASERGEKVSSFAKWIPREKSSFDTKLGFVDIMARKLFPDAINKFNARAQFRRYVANLNKYRGTLEIFLCSKEYSKIDFNKVPIRKLRRHIKTIVNNDETRLKLENFLIQRYRTHSLLTLINKCLNPKISDFEKEVINKLWKEHKSFLLEEFRSEIPIDLYSHDLVLDLSNYIYSIGSLGTVLAVSLLAIESKNNIFINAHKPFQLKTYYDEGFTEILERIKGESYNCDTVKIDEIRILNNKEKSILIITDKKVDPDETTSIWRLNKKSLSLSDCKKVLSGSIENKGKNYKSLNLDKTKGAIIKILNDSEEMIEAHERYLGPVLFMMYLALFAFLLYNYIIV